MAKKKRKQAKKPQQKRSQPAPSHRRDFDQLLDDAIFGVKPKARRG